MNDVRVDELASHVGETVTVRGWLYHRRSSGKLHFLEVRDGSGIVQCVVAKQNVTPEAFARADHIGQESSVEVVGIVKEHGRMKGQYEIDAVDVRVLAAVAREYPIGPKEHGTDFLMDHRHLWLRSKRQHAILRVRHAIIKAVRDFFDERGFTLIDAPIFTPNACEGTSTLFETDYHGGKAYLTQSGQLYMEAAAAAFGRVYCFGPTFRAEKSKTRRHLAEFWMVEPEVAFMDLDGDMQLAEECIAFIVARVLETRREELKVLERDASKLERVTAPFPRITYHEAIDILRRNGHSEAKVGDDFGADEETVISSQFDRPVVVHRYPMELKAFYSRCFARCERMTTIHGPQRCWQSANRPDSHLSYSRYCCVLKASLRQRYTNLCNWHAARPQDWRCRWKYTGLFRPRCRAAQTISACSCWCRVTREKTCNNSCAFGGQCWTHCRQKNCAGRWT